MDTGVSGDFTKTFKAEIAGNRPNSATTQVHYNKKKPARTDQTAIEREEKEERFFLSLFTCCPRKKMSKCDFDKGQTAIG